MPIGAKPNFFARASSEKVVFACSLEKNAQKKIKADLKAAAESIEKVDRVVFLTTEDVPVGRRHKLQQFAIENYGLHLDIYARKHKHIEAADQLVGANENKPTCAAGRKTEPR